MKTYDGFHLPLKEGTVVYMTVRRLLSIIDPQAIAEETISGVVRADGMTALFGDKIVPLQQCRIIEKVIRI